MKTGPQILKENGYEPSSFDSRAFMATIEKFFLQSRNDAVLTMRSVYFGDFTGDVRKRGFFADIDNEYSDKLLEVKSAYLEEMYQDEPPTKEEATHHVCEKYGENYVLAVSLFSPSGTMKLYDVVVDPQYIHASIALIRMQQYNVKKKTKKGIDYYEVSLL